MKHRTFRNPVVLNTMLYLRLQGWPLKELAIIFRCDKTSIRKACIRNNFPTQVQLLPRPEVKFQWIFIDELEGRINPGKNYQEYLAEERRKQLARQDIKIE